MSEVAFHRGEGCDPAIDLGSLGAAMSALLGHFPREIARVDALLVGDEAMDEAHRRHSGIVGTTDVLSFPAHDESDRSAPVEVDLIISTGVAHREAAARGHGVEDELLLYAVHGTLHACGLRDDTEAAAAEIHAEEARILVAGGRPAVYDREARDGNPGGSSPNTEAPGAELP